MATAAAAGGAAGAGRVTATARTRQARTSRGERRTSSMAGPPRGPPTSPNRRRSPSGACDDYPSGVTGPDPTVVWIIDAEQWPRALLRAELIERGFDAVG